MRGLLMAFFLFDFPGFAAGRRRAPAGTTKITAKTTVATV